MVTNSPKRSPFIIPILVFFSLAIMIFLVVVINFVKNPPVKPTFTTVALISTLTSQPSPSPTNTTTITLTPRPTWTLRPSATVTKTPTPTFTLTPTLIRTITPAKPVRFNDRYELKPWDLSEQSRTIELLRANTILSPSDKTYNVLAYAEGEAFLRFPEALEATHWRWDRAYNLIRIRDPQAVTLYAELIKPAINSGQVRTGDLTGWFRQHESRLSLQTSPFPPQPGELGRVLIEITGEGSAFLWLVENPVETSIYPLINDINFDQPHENALLYDDLTGDNIPELVIYRRDSPDLTQLITPHIFDVSVSPPTELPIQDQIPINFGLEFRTEAGIGTSSEGTKYLQVTSILLPSCPTVVTQDYKWSEATFSVSSLQYNLNPLSELLAYCEIVIDAASNSWGPEPAISIINPLLDLWPPKTDIQGRPYPNDAFDQLRYRLGILYALAGLPSEAVRYLSAVVNTPIVVTSTWIKPAQQFLQAYIQSQDLYTACQQAQFCNLHDALSTMVKNSGMSDPTHALVYLQQNGVATLSSGIFDFDQDGQDERWVIIQPKPEAKLEFWILSQIVNGVQAIFVQVFEATESLPYYHEPSGILPVVQFELHKGFIFKRLIDTHEAYIQWVDVEYARPTVIRDEYYLALSALMEGADPAAIRDTLLELLNSPRFIGDCIAFNICAQFHYTLGLVYNLTHDDTNAIDQYLWVWRNYDQSPYSLLARLKLNYLPLPTYTQSVLPSRTPTVTRSPTSATQTSTLTVTPSITVTPTITHSPTATGTSTFTATP